MAHLKRVLPPPKKIIIATSNAVMASTVEVIMGSGVSEEVPKKSALDLFNLIVDGSINFGVFYTQEFFEEIARKRFFGKDIAEKMVYRKISIREQEEIFVLFSAFNFKPNGKKLIKVISESPYYIQEILEKKFPGYKIVVAEGENNTTIKQAKKVIEIHSIIGEAIAEFKSGEYDLGFGVKHPDVDFRKEGLKTFDTEMSIMSVTVIVALKKTAELDETVRAIEAVVKAKDVCELKVCIPEGAQSQAEKVLVEFNIRISEGQSEYKWITVVIPLNRQQELKGKLKDIGATEITAASVMTHEKDLNGKT